MIDVQHLDYKNILSDINFSFSKNKLTGIIGPNGSGKTTLIRAITGQIKADKGNVLINGKDIQSYSIKERASTLAVLSQHANQQLDFLVKDIVIMGLYNAKKNIFSYSKAEKNKVDEILDFLHISHLKNRSFQTLSGGEKQRVLLARALCQDVKILILDEPLNHLDLFYQIDLMEVIKGLGITVICVLHDFTMALKYCDSLLVMKQGKIHYSGDKNILVDSSVIQEAFGVSVEFVSKDNKQGIIY